VERLRTAVGDRLVVGDADDQHLLPLEHGPDAFLHGELPRARISRGGKCFESGAVRLGALHEIEGASISGSSGAPTFSPMKRSSDVPPPTFMQVGGSMNAKTIIGAPEVA
jgi:hypothetical protein